jgi:hypothetical protein
VVTVVADDGRITPRIEDSRSIHRYRAATQEISQADNFLDALQTLGVCNGFASLRQVEVTPETCMRNASLRLRFCGYGGSKWRDEPWFIECLRELRGAKGEVQFLLPKETTTSKSITQFRELLTEWSDVLSVRLYSGDPIFRIVIIDDRWTLLSHYRYGQTENDVTNALGWTIPQLLIDNQERLSLGKAFLVYFGQVWLSAEDLAATDELARTERYDSFRADS